MGANVARARSSKRLGDLWAAGAANNTRRPLPGSGSPRKRRSTASSLQLIGNEGRSPRRCGSLGAETDQARLAGCEAPKRRFRRSISMRLAADRVRGCVPESSTKPRPSAGGNLTRWGVTARGWGLQRNPGYPPGATMDDWADDAGEQILQRNPGHPPGATRTLGSLVIQLLGLQRNPGHAPGAAAELIGVSEWAVYLQRNPGHAPGATRSPRSPKRAPSPFNETPAMRRGQRPVGGGSTRNRTTLQRNPGHAPGATRRLESTADYAQGPSTKPRPCAGGNTGLRRHGRTQSLPSTKPRPCAGGNRRPRLGRSCPRPPFNETPAMCRGQRAGPGHSAQAADSFNETPAMRRGQP